MSQPVDNIERVEIGSFDRDSPFYQMNLNDLAPFAILQVRRLDVYPLIGIDCSEGNHLFVLYILCTSSLRFRQSLVMRQTHITNPTNSGVMTFFFILC